MFDTSFAFPRSLLHPVSGARGRVAVVGAGVAGLVCAYELQRRGLDVVVYVSARLGGDPVRPLAAELLRLARAGLSARVAAGVEPPHVPAYLDPLDDLVETGSTFADRCLRRWHGDLHRDPARYVAAYRV
ncbi:FAD-dependent oxidoreductase [Kitasatospora sp. NPDC059973]|uniref:FAD-dependent oxidoreductase n=1 Tax=Kitasatospora sp. NPDC059973 TaxID=3347020 RepID=UPI0036B15D7C